MQNRLQPTERQLFTTSDLKTRTFSRTDGISSDPKKRADLAQ